MNIQRRKAERYASIIGAVGDAVIGLYEAQTDQERAAFHEMLSGLGVTAKQAGENLSRAMRAVTSS